MRPFLVVATLFLGLVVASRAGASPLYYTLTDLGTSDTLQTDAKGYPYGVTNAAGTVTYALDKSPVVESLGPVVETWGMGLMYSQDTTFQTQGGSYSVTTEWWELSPVVQSYELGRPGVLFGRVWDVNIHGEMIGPANGGALGVLGIPGVPGGFAGELTTDSYLAPTTLPSGQFYLTGWG